MLKRKNSLKILDKTSKAKIIIKKLKKENKNIPIILVPTMGALHQGHLSLIKKAEKYNGIIIVSIFVNPIQFNDKNDLKNYPNTLRADIEKLKELGVDYLFLPTVKDIFNSSFQTTVSVNELQKFLCGKHRPGHFNGVSTIVLKLFNIINPDIAVFGRKDFQQLAIIKRMVIDLNLDIKILEGEIIREESGLALSSRNKLLTKKNYEIAQNIYQGLMFIRSEFKKGKKSSVQLKRLLVTFYQSKGIRNIEYINIVDRNSLIDSKTVRTGNIIAVAIKLGKIRLIDNLKF
tara:strand:+ start:497 stop:1363 length:867 start_codon:yes stop_codon:yes gene_type:complete